MSVENMGSGVCSRKQRKIFQSLLLLTVVFVLIYGGMMWYEMHQQLKRTESLALKYQQHQESLSAQLQGIRLWSTSSRRSLETVETFTAVLLVHAAKSALGSAALFVLENVFLGRGLLSKSCT